MRAAVALVLAALATRAMGQESDAARGERLARDHCAACHAIGRTGASPRAGAPAFRDLHARYPVDQLAEALAEGIVTGHTDMPEQSFAPEDVDALIAYLHSLER